MFLYDIYIEGLFRPLLNLLVYLYDVLPGADIGVAIIVLTLIVKFALLPLSRQSIKSQKALQDLQPQLENIKTKYKNDKEKQSKELMQFYKKNKVNPFSSCLPLLVQLPILLALYRVFREGLSNPEELSFLYSFVPHPGVIDPMSFGAFDLSQPSLMLAIFAGAFQFVQSWMMIRKRKEDNKDKKLNKKKPRSPEQMTSAMTTQMTYIMPILTVFIAMSLPAGLAFYWITVTIFSIIQQWHILYGKKKDDKKKDGGDGKVLDKPKEIQNQNGTT